MEKTPEGDKIVEIEEIVHNPSISNEGNESKITELKHMVSDPDVLTDYSKLTEIDKISKAADEERKKNQTENSNGEVLINENEKTGKVDPSSIKKLENELGFSLPETEKGKEKKENENPDKQKKLPPELENVSIEMRKCLEDVKATDSAKNKKEGLLSRLGIGKKHSEANKDYNESLKNAVTLFKIYEDTRKNNNFKLTEEQENFFKDFENILNDKKEKKSENVENILNVSQEEVDSKIGNLSPEKKIFFEKAKKILGDKRLHFVIGMVIIGLAIAAPPTGALAFYTFGLLPGVLPASAATMATAAGGAFGGLFVGNTIRELLRKVKVDNGEPNKVFPENTNISSDNVKGNNDIKPEDEVEEIKEPEETGETNVINEEMFDNPVASGQFQDAQKKWNETPETPDTKTPDEEASIDDAEEMFDNPVASGQFQDAQKKWNETPEAETPETETSESKEEESTEKKYYLDMIQKGIDKKSPMQVGLRDGLEGKEYTSDYKIVEILKDENKFLVHKDQGDGKTSTMKVKFEDLVFGKNDQYRGN